MGCGSASRYTSDFDGISKMEETCCEQFSNSSDSDGRFILLEYEGRKQSR